MDIFAGKCGVKLRNSDECREPPESDPRCPVPPEVNFSMTTASPGDTQFYGCCTENNQCGIGIITQLNLASPFAALVGNFSSADLKCLARQRLCSYVASMGVSPESLEPQTCDGEPIPIEASCNLMLLP